MAADKKRQSCKREHQVVNLLVTSKMEGIKYPRKANYLLQEKNKKFSKIFKQQW